MTTISERLTTDLKAAMRAGEKLRVDTIRGARAALQSAQLEAAKQKYDAAARVIEDQHAHDSAAREAALAAISADAHDAARVIEAQHAHDSAAREAALAAISADAHAPLDQAAEEAVIAKEIKRRYDAAEMYQKGGRPELAAQEQAERELLQAYLPKLLSADELRPEAAALLAELGLSGPTAMGKLMPALLAQFKGRADSRTISQVARDLLTGT